ncbi:conserved hypothetical protein [Denitrovibrio acetiphilus DSM 12809]|uniref:Phosphodiesterase n=1 Tax=Denitrovibrio acetiphilus (strain DSM 12809 / NBRC 114555 / N2460) TaxID=522772 RepID=D4H582_DENA2|nr:hypothetical protein [Denitrovibrio acetiphilus]ADD69438.1 conserved hypothetical protein [Denitrovibrio acetiphilus DSM 12809]
MIVLSHRGYWKDTHEKNTPIAFKRSFELGFGTETDFRDLDGELVISHDMPRKGDCISAKEFFDIYSEIGKGLPLALNIKADGLQQKLMDLLSEYSVTNYFVFDMSLPDSLQYIKYDIIAFTRQSEYELDPAFYDKAAGVWMDEFHGHWIDEAKIKQHINAEKQVCIVSPDLHKRDYQAEWREYKEIDKKLDSEKLMICTDYPEEARLHFNE